MELMLENKNTKNSNGITNPSADGNMVQQDKSSSKLLT